MEVHHHAQHRDRKKWTHYFWEFLMLFLAVFSGFLAEYQLEHMIEHKKEKQFINALLEDLKLDTIGMKACSMITKSSALGMDSLSRLIWNTSITKRHAKRLHELKFAYTGKFRRVIFSKSALTQLKNSGNLRLIRMVKITDNILRYDLASEMMDKAAQKIEDFVTDNYKAEYSIFNDKFWPGNYESPAAYENADFELLTYDRKELTAYANRIAHQKVAMEAYINKIIPAQKDRAEQLIALLKKEYHLK